MRDPVFEALIYEYIETHEHENINSVDIGVEVLPYGSMDMEDVMNALAYLENDAAIKRVSQGIRYIYIII